MTGIATGEGQEQGRFSGGTFRDGARDVLSLSASDMTPLGDPRQRAGDLANTFCPATVGVLGLDDPQAGDWLARDILLLRFD